MQSLHTIIITQGDAAGIGPEVAWRAIESWKRPDDCRLIVLGYPAHITPHLPPGARLPEFIPWNDIVSQRAVPGVLWVSPGDESLNQAVLLGQGSEIAARAAILCIERAVEAALADLAGAVCTAPISKENLKQAGFAYPGHTEMLAARCGNAEVAMLLSGGGLRVVLATIHEPLARVPALLNREKLVRLLKLSHDAMPDFGIENPRIGVAGLNPHAGEAGHFGREEIEIIEPAIRAARDLGIAAGGPFSADTLFYRALHGEFDLCIAMYHDQGLIPVKTLDFHGGVNITIGLPFVRTSPDHGTAYGIAGKGLAHPGSMIAAIEAAYSCSKRRAKRMKS